MHTGPSGLYSVFLPIHLAAHPTNSVRTSTKSICIHIRLPTTPFGLRPYLSTISVWTLWPYPSIPQLHPSGHPPNPSGLAYPSASTFDCPQLHSDSDHICLPFLSGLCGLICPSHNSVRTPSHSIHIFSFFGQTFGTLTCVCPSPMDNILSDWAQSPFIPITIHLHTFVPILAHPAIHLPTLATPNSVCLAQILWIIHPYMLSYTLDTHCHPMAPSTQPPTIHIHRLKGHSVGLIAKPV